MDWKEVTRTRISSRSAPRVIWVGRISLEKRIDFIMKAFSIFSKEKSNARLILVGDGPYKDHYFRYSQDIGISDKVEWTGYKEDVFTYLLEGHVFVHACISEEFGYTLVEAMATGLPVIAYDCPHGPGEVLDGGKYGLLVKSEEEMGLGLLEMFEDLSLWRYFSEKSIERSRYYDIELISKQYATFFERILR
ncbi:MAG: glycosyltransferase [Thermodesulforhabdaceae bacterium]